MKTVPKPMFNHVCKYKVWGGTYVIVVGSLVHPRESLKDLGFRVARKAKRLRRVLTRNIKVNGFSFLSNGVLDSDAWHDTANQFSKRGHNNISFRIASRDVRGTRCTRGTS